jgi:hypothetical protein
MALDRFTYRPRYLYSAAQGQPDVRMIPDNAATCFLGLYLLLSLITIAANAREEFGTFLGVGVGAMILRHVRAGAGRARQPIGQREREGARPVFAP